LWLKKEPEKGSMGSQTDKKTGGKRTKDTAGDYQHGGKEVRKK